MARSRFSHQARSGVCDDSDMSRARFLTSVIAALYFGALIGLTFVPGSTANRSSPLWPFVLFVPVGVLLLLLLGTRRWWTALGFGALGAAWVEAAQTIWMPVGYADAWDVVWASAGVGTGVLLAVVAVRLRSRSMRSHGAPSMIAHAGGREIPRAE